MRHSHLVRGSGRYKRRMTDAFDGSRSADVGVGVDPDLAQSLTSKPTTVWITMLAIAARLIAAGLLIFGPWTDEPAELSGWDIERFTIIATEEGTPWRDNPVEYPPGSVVIFEALTAGDSDAVENDVVIVRAHRILILLALAADLVLAWLLYRRSSRAGLGYLILGLPLVPMGLLRLDVVVALLATAAALLAVGSGRREIRPDGTDLQEQPDATVRFWRPDLGAAILTAAAILTKVWPGLLIPAFWGTRRDRTAVAAVLTTALGLVAWLAWARAGFDPIRQVVDLRGATGWHVESSGGVLTVLADVTGVVPLTGESPAQFQLNAFRIGRISPTLVTAGRLATVAVTVGLAWRARSGTDHDNDHDTEVLVRFGAVMLGATSVLLATSPLLSPQFILWLTPWAALTLTGRPTRRITQPAVITAVIAVLTGATLAVFGPPRMAEIAPAALMAFRNVALLTLPFSCWRLLGLDPGSGG